MSRGRQLLRRLGAVGWHRAGLAAWTLVLLCGARVALRWLPVRWIVAWLGREFRQRQQSTAGRLGAVAEVQWAVAAVVQWAPVRFVCFPQCVAATLLLRGRGIGSVLHYGVMRRGERLETHTWLSVGEAIVVGGEVAGDFTEMARYGQEV